jgi:hypothetical protein
MRRPHRCKSPGLGLYHASEGIVAKCALLLQVGPDFIDGELRQYLADDGTVGIGPLPRGAPQA